VNKNTSAISKNFKGSFTSLETEFIHDFASYLDIVIEESQKKSKSIKTICRNIFEKYTKPFFQKWSEQPLISMYLVSNQTFEKKYYSFGLSEISPKLLNTTSEGN